MHQYKLHCKTPCGLLTWPVHRKERALNCFFLSTNNQIIWAKMWKVVLTAFSFCSLMSTEQSSNGSSTWCKRSWKWNVSIVWGFFSQHTPLTYVRALPGKVHLTCYHMECRHPWRSRGFYTFLLFFDAYSCISAPLPFCKLQANDQYLDGMSNWIKQCLWVLFAGLQIQTVHQGCN